MNVKFPKIQRLAAKLGADIGFQDESGVGIMTRYGKTWGLRGETPVVKASMKRGGYNVMSVIFGVSAKEHQKDTFFFSVAGYKICYENCTM